MLLFALVIATSAVLWVGTFAMFREYLRVRRVRQASGPATVGVVLWDDAETPVSEALIRAISVLDLAPADRVVLGTLRAQTPASSSTGPRDQALRIHRASAEQGVPATATAAQAASSLPDGVEVVVLVDPCARPACREVRPIVDAVAAHPNVLAASACPTASAGFPGLLGSFMGRITADLTPVLFAWFGPRGLPPAVVAIRSDAIRTAVRDPLFAFHPSLAAAVLWSLPRSRVVLLPGPVGTAPSGGPGSLRRLVAMHLSVLARASRLRSLLVAGGLAALPISLAFAAVAGGWGWLAFAMNLAARAVTSATWTRSVLGTGPAVAAVVTSPVRDLVALGVCAAAVMRATIRSGGRSFRVRGGGVLVPVES